MEFRRRNANIFFQKEVTWVNNYPVPYQTNWGFSGTYPQYPAQQSTAQTNYTPQMQTTGMKWVDGESEARGTPMPAGTTQYAMWDINDQVVYIKSLNQIGMPNPMRKAHYWFDGEDKTSGEAEKPVQPDMNEYVRKDDMERMKQELMDTINGLSISGRSDRRESSF